MQIKTRMGLYLDDYNKKKRQKIARVYKVVEKLEPIAGVDIKW